MEKTENWGREPEVTPVGQHSAIERSIRRQSIAWEEALNAVIDLNALALSKEYVTSGDAVIINSSLQALRRAARQYAIDETAIMQKRKEERKTNE